MMTNLDKIKQMTDGMRNAGFSPEEKAELEKYSEFIQTDFNDQNINSNNTNSENHSSETHFTEEPISQPTTQNSLTIVNPKEVKAITDISLSDVKVAIDTTKSAGQQTEEVIDFAATIAAAQDQETVSKISEAKKEEIVDKATVKAKEAKAKSVEADTIVQQAKMEKFQLLFETFGVTKHIPDWLLSCLMCIFAPFYIIFVILIGIPTGFIRFLTDAIDGILVRYDETEAGRKPRLKVTVLIVLILIIVAAICLTILGCLHVI